MKKEIIGFIIGTILLFPLLSGCGSTASPTIVTLPPSATSAGTPINEATPTSPAPSQTPALSLPVLPGTPVAMPNEPITPENVDRIQQLAMWGKGRIVQIAYSPNDKYIAVGTLAGVWLYDAETLAELHFINPGNFVESLAFTLDSQELVVDVGASTLTRWEIPSGKLISSVKVRDGYSGNVTASPIHSTLSPGAKLLAAILDEQSVGVWETETGRQIGIFEVELASFSDSINNLSFSPDQTSLAITTKNKNTIQLLDIETGSSVHTMVGSDGQIITELTFSSNEDKDEMMLASGGTDQKIWLWNVKAGTSIRILEEPAIFGGIITFSPDSRFLASSSAQRSSSTDTINWNIQLWQVSDGKLLKTFRGHTNTIKSLTFSPDNKLLISGSDDGTVRWWNIETGEEVESRSGFGRGDRSIPLSINTPLSAFQSDNQMFVSNPFNFEIELWELATGQRLETLAGHKSPVKNLVISPDAPTLASTEFWENSVFIWNTETTQILTTYDFYIDVGFGKSLVIWPDGEKIAGADSRSRGVRVADTKTGEILYTLRTQDRGIFDIALASDGSRLAVASGTAELTIADGETGEILYTLNSDPHGGGIAFSPDGAFLATGTRDGAIQLWNVSSGQLANTLTGNIGNPITSLAFSPDGNLIVAGERDPQLPTGSLFPTIHFWEVQTGRYLNAIDGYMFNALNLNFSPGGKFLASSSYDGTMRLWGVPPR